MIDRCPRLFIPRNEISSGLTYDLIKISRQPVAGRFAFFSFFFFFFFLFAPRWIPRGNGGDFVLFLSFFFFAAIIGFGAVEIGDGSEDFAAFLNKRADFRHHFAGLLAILETIFFSFRARHICKFPRVRERMDCRGWTGGRLGWSARNEKEWNRNR